MHLTPIPLPGEITSTHTHMCMYVHCFSCSPITFGLCARDTSTTLPSGVSCFWLLFCFCLMAFYLLKNRNLPAFGCRSLFFHRLPSCPVTTLRSGPTESAPEPAPFREPTESAPEPAPFREPTESAPEPAPFWEPTESAPEPATVREPTHSVPVREPTHSAPGPAPFREPTQSAPEPAPFREPTQSAPEPAPFREPTHSSPFQETTHSGPGAHALRSAPWADRVRPRARSAPWADRVHSRACSTLVASCSGCPALAPLAAFSSGPSSTTWAWPPHPFPYSAPALPFPWLEAWERLEAVPLKGGSVRSPGLASSLSPPEGTTSFPPGLINFTPHTCLPTHHSQLVSICGLFMHLTPIPLAGEITSTRTHLCMRL